MTHEAPEQMPEALLIKLVDNASSVCDGMYINAAGGTKYTRAAVSDAEIARLKDEVLLLKTSIDASNTLLKHWMAKYDAIAGK